MVNSECQMMNGKWKVSLFLPQTNQSPACTHLERGIGAWPSRLPCGGLILRLMRWLVKQGRAEIPQEWLKRARLQQTQVDDRSGLLLLAV